MYVNSPSLDNRATLVAIISHYHVNAKMNERIVRSITRRSHVSLPARRNLEAAVSTIANNDSPTIMSDVQINFLLSLQSAAYLFMGVQESRNEFLSRSSREIRRSSVFVFEFLNLIGTFSVFELMKPPSRNLMRRFPRVPRVSVPSARREMQCP